MTDAIAVRLDAAFVLAVTGAALIVPWLALLVGAAFFIGNAIWAWRSPPQTEAQ